MRAAEQRSFTFSVFDLVVLSAIVALGLFELLACAGTEPISSDSSVYIVLSQNLLRNGSYEFNCEPHTIYPPGFPMLLAGVSFVTGSSSNTTLTRFVPLLGTAGFIVWYLILRNVWGRRAAACACLLSATSGPVFTYVTRAILSDMPYFAISGAGIWCAMSLERQLKGWQSAALRSLLVLFTLMAVAIRSVGIAWCVALLAWALWYAPRHLRRISVLAALAGLLTFAAWIASTKARATTTPGSYAGQFTMKDPHRPELGPATPADLMMRAASNLASQTTQIAALLTRAGWVNPLWYSPFVLITIILLGLGVRSALCESSGALLALYFCGYMVVYLLWPFSDEGPRFVLPVAPLAFTLIWRGAASAGPWLRLAAPVAAAVILLAGVTSSLAGVQAKIFLAFWGCVALIALALKRVSYRPALPRHAVPVTVAILLLAGLWQQIGLARENLSGSSGSTRHAASTDASRWLTVHEGAVMAQQSAILHRLTGRCILPFPITSQPAVIADAMKRGNVRYLVVNTPNIRDEYFFPTEEDRLAQLQKTDPNGLHLVHTGFGYRIYETK